jgi:uncharacterized repeat protein (TIGR03803 family)
VACLADPSIWLVANNGEEGVVGGTSAAAPLWAGFTALLNEQATANHQANIGFLNPAIYSIGASSNQATAFHDITIGNNTNAASQNEFFAVPGYDLCTGWGTPAGTNLINALRPAPDTLHITPATSVTFIGPVGGAFNPVAQTFHLTNNGASTLNWSLGNTSVWFNVSPAGGSLSAGAGAVISITPTTSANVLAAGQYTATLFFADLNDGFSFDRQIRLNVVNPIETAAGVAFSNLYSFSGGSDDGANPNGLMQSSNGVLYGTTQNGGSNSYGTIFQLTTNGVLTNLYSFTGGDDGANPFDTPMQDAGGNFYGTTFQAGQYDNGTIFRLAPDGRFTTLLAFDITNGDLPFAGLTAGADGNFYGTTYQGGAYGRGTAYRLTASGVLTTLYSFANGSDGGHVAAGLIEGSDGNFYGTTWKGGDYGVGTVFSISTNRTLTTLASFDNTNGAFPFGGLAQDATGNFYGVASQGGAFGDGTVFKITPAGQLTNLYSFTGGGDGANPRAALLLGADGNFYGSTANGGVQGNGTIFVISPDGTLTTLVVFNGLDGANPQAALTQGNDGRLYGTTHNGGVNNKGVIFRLGITSAPQITSQPVNRSVFAGADVEFSVSVLGSVPLSYQWQKNGTNLTDGGVIFSSTNRILQLANVTTNDAGIYSVIVTNALGYTNSLGASLAVTSSPPFIVMQPTNQTLAAGETATFSVRAFGNLPLIYRWQMNGTNLADGGSISGSETSTLKINSVTVANEGTYVVIVSNALDSVVSSNVVLTVEAVSAPGTVLSTLHWFGVNGGGWSPNGLTRARNGDLYGTTQLGTASGSYGAGTIFKITTNGVFTTLVSFGVTADASKGSEPLAALAEDTNGNFYGTTEFGGTNNVGNIFKLTPDNNLINLYSFTGGDDGENPDEPLILGKDGYLYGVMATFGGGNIFRITPDGAFTNIYLFTSDDGGPTGSLLRSADGNFYGMTGSGGAYGYGIVFKLSLDGVLTRLHSFSGGPDGSTPVGALIQGTDGLLYGATEYSSTNLGGTTFQQYGTVFKLTTNGVMTTLHEFGIGGTGNGIYPYAGLIQGSDGNFYGTTHGNQYGNLEPSPSPLNGTVFRLTPEGALTTLVEFDGFDDGARPSSVLVEGEDGALYGTTTAGGPTGRGTIFRLAFTTEPQVTAEPDNQTVVVGGNAMFSVAVSGAPQLFYQWRRDGTNLLDGGGLFGSTNRILTVTNASFADTGNYSVVVSNSLGSVTSSNALLTVVLQPAFQSITQSNGAITLVWNAINGQKYQLQSTSNLASTNWFTLDTITATNSIVTASDVIGTNAQMFYRIVQLP